MKDTFHEPPAPRCYWVVPGKLLAGGHPEIVAILDAGIRTIVRLVEEDVAYEPVARRRGVSCVRIPIPDFSVASVETMRAILDTIDRSLDQGRPVYVHCLGGIGRTGTVVGCWLRRHGLASREDVLAVLQQLRRADVARANIESPETAAQREMVREWQE